MRHKTAGHQSQKVRKLQFRNLAMLVGILLIVLINNDINNDNWFEKLSNGIKFLLEIEYIFLSPYP